MGAISPGQIAFNYPNQYYDSHETYLGALADELSYEYQAITDAGLQPPDRLARHGDGGPLPLGRARASATGTRTCHWRSRRSTPRSTGSRPSRSASTSAGATTAGRTTRTCRSPTSSARCCKVNAGTIYVEGANPRHAHEWRVFEETHLPDDSSVILGVIDVKSNHVEHPRVVADRLVQLGKIVGKERLLGGHRLRL